MTWKKQLKEFILDLGEIPLWEILTEVEDIIIRKALDESKTTKEAADRLGIKRTTLKYKRDKLGIVSEKFAEPERLKEARLRDAAKASEIASQKQIREEKRKHASEIWPNTRHYRKLL